MKHEIYILHKGIRLCDSTVMYYQCYYQLSVTRIQCKQLIPPYFGPVLDKKVQQKNIFNNKNATKRDTPGPSYRCNYTQF